MKEKLLAQLIQQFHSRHNRLPDEIVVAPAAMAALGIKGSLAPSWNGIPVYARLFSESDVVERGEKLGVFLKNEGTHTQVVGCELA